jgi:hypothetical protein
LKEGIILYFKYYIISIKRYLFQINMQEIEFKDDYPCWACQLKSYCDTWTHARRKRRMNMRQEALKKQCIRSSESNNEIEELELNQSELIQHADKSKHSNEPLLICTLVIGENSEICDNNEKVEDMKIFKICMVFESGYGGKLSLETLRQYLINKLDIQNFLQKQNPNKPNKKKRKRR